MSAVLADANVLIALMIAEHVHHEPAQTWFAGRDADQPMAICPMTEGALVRAYLREGLGRAVRGHRQVTDAYLASLAAHHGGHLAMFDKGLAATYQDLAILIG